VTVTYSNAAGKIEQINMVMTKSAYVTWTNKMGQSSKINIPFTVKTAATETTPAVYHEDYKKIDGINPFAVAFRQAQSFTVQGATICVTEQGSKLLEKAGAMPLEDDYSKTGAVSIQWINNWGVVCEPDWDTPDASVFCNSIMGYSGIPITGTSKSIEAKEHVWLTNVTCTGTEPTLYTCGNTGWDTIDSGAGCDKKTYAGVQCFKKGYQDLKLIGDYDWVYRLIWKGIVAIKYNDQWGSMCSATKWSRYESDGEDVKLWCEKISIMLL
jgi:hypothetical protein